MVTEIAGGFVCGMCGERHALPLRYSVNAPEAAMAVPAAEREARVMMTRDQCVIDGTAFYLRGRFPVPVIGMEAPFIWGVWAEIGGASFVRAAEMWKVEGREAEASFAGVLNNRLPIYMAEAGAETMGLEVEVRTQVVGVRPSFFVADAGHPLAQEQRVGITLTRVEEIAVWMVHGESRR